MSGIVENLYKVQKKDVLKAGEVLADAFQHDPLWNKVFEDESMLDQKACAFFESPIRYCLKYGEVYATSKNLEGIATLTPGELAEMPIWRIIRSGAIKSGIKAGARILKKSAPIFKQLDEDRRGNMMSRHFIYLMIFGVSTKLQGKGLGGKLLSSLIEKSKQTGMPLYLETQTEKNVKMYERFGFMLIKRINLKGIEIPIWEMVREP
ncbi:GNAT family N-acetyltransferase [Candidatus Peregrinibacteria bacterium]|nr:GNAT family N-acetyltransferase [Candidatus Peregrinibacteria bacterium]